MSTEEQENQIYYSLFPICLKITKHLTLDEYQSILRHRTEFIDLLITNVQCPIRIINGTNTSLNKNDWHFIRQYDISPSYSQWIKDILGIKGDVSTICLSSLIPTYPPQRAYVLFNKSAENNPNLLFPTLNGTCLIVPALHLSQISKWPSWDIYNFPFIFPII